MWLRFAVHVFFLIITIGLVKVFTMNPVTISGNGNLAILVSPFAILAFLLFGIDVVMTLLNANLTLKAIMYFILGSLLVLGISIVLEYHFAVDLIHRLGGPPTEESSRIYRFGWLNQYTNTIFINFYTLVIFISTLTFFTSSVLWITQRLKS
jgi:hypothetical protein